MRDYIRFNGPSIREITDSINRRNECIIHPGNYIIDPFQTEYFPVQYINANFMEADLEQKKLSSYTALPLHSIERAMSIRDNLSNGMARLSVSDFTYHYLLSAEDLITFSNNMIIRNNEVLFCIAVKSEFLIETINQYIETFSDKPFIRMLVDNQIHEDPDLLETIYSVFLKDISSLYEPFENNAVVFVNTQGIKRLANDIGTSSYESFLYRFEGRFRIIDESSDNYIASKLFVSPKMPTFNDIEEPDRIVKEILGSWSSPDIQAEFPYIPA